ncbi:MAG: ADP-binding protein [Candidatus Parcubacteria bacterium]|jgi:tRNA threonylcarbamoyladenosine biosynthesis protein TsaE
MEIGETREIKKEDIDVFVGEILVLLQKEATAGATILALHGDLGAGKTTLTQALGRRLGVTESIVSPTFTIMKGYETTSDTFTHLIHMDAYRIDDTAELGPLRFLDILAAPQTLFVIEWAEKIVDALPPHILNLSLAVASETTRTATLSRS